MDVIFFNLNETETLIVDTVEHELLSKGNDQILPWIASLVTLGMILGTNVPLIAFILNQASKSFLDWLMVFDCFLGMSNTLILLKILLISSFGSYDNFWGNICGCNVFFSFFTNICNRLVTIGIATYRFTLVHLSSRLWTPNQRKMFEKTILQLILISSVYLTGLAVYYREDSRAFLGNTHIIFKVLGIEIESNQELTVKSHIHQPTFLEAVN